MKKTYLIALVIITTISLWMFSGVLFPSEKHAGLSIENAVGNKAPVKVRVAHITAQQQNIEIKLMGKTEAKRVVDLKAELGGRIMATPVDKGQRVKAGDVLCELAEDDRPVQLERAKATLEQARIDYEGALSLQKDGLISSTAIAGSKSALEGAKAALKVAELNVGYLKIRAPFAGYVEDRPAQVGALIERGGICAILIDESSLLATGQVSERDVYLLALGQPVQVELVSKQVFNGKISFIGRTADPSTRTYTVEAELEVNNSTVRDGVTATVHIPLQQVLAHHISPAVLALDDEGKVGVRTVNASNKVEFHLVNVVRETDDGVWITGLPDEVNLITVGQELVSEGDTVDAVFTETKTAEVAAEKSTAVQAQPVSGNGTEQ